ncbi:MAG: peptidoglycan recognition family protein [Balneolaceae bacterium]
MNKIFSTLLVFVIASIGFIGCSKTTPEKTIVTEPNIMSVEEWGGNKPLATKEPQKIEYITIHHSGVVFPEGKDPVQGMRNLQKFSQVDKEWIDIPYHFSMDLDGNTYAARPIEYAGDTNTEYDPTGHALIEVMGNYEEQTIKPAQLDSLAHLTAWLAQKYDVPVSNIASHKDFSDQTVCPGADLYKYFEDGSFIEKVKAYLGEK